MSDAVSCHSYVQTDEPDFIRMLKSEFWKRTVSYGAQDFPRKCQKNSRWGRRSSASVATPLLKDGMLLVAAFQLAVYV